MCYVGCAYAWHKLAATIAPSFTVCFGGQACSGACQQTVTGQESPRVGDSVIGKHILAEFVPFGGVTQVHVVLFSFDCAEEYIVVDTAKEHYMAVSHRCASAAYNSLQYLFAFAICGVVSPRLSR